MTSRADVRPVICPPFVFIPHPKDRGVWMRTDISVVIVACSLCRAEIGEPCNGSSDKNRVVGVTVGTHISRQRISKGVKALRMLDLARNKRYRFPGAAWWVAHEFEQHGFRNAPT